MSHAGSLIEEAFFTAAALKAFLTPLDSCSGVLWSVGGFYN